MNILIFVLRLIGSFHMSFTDFTLPNEGFFGDCLSVYCGGSGGGRRGWDPKYKCPESYNKCISVYYISRLYLSLFREKAKVHPWGHSWQFSGPVAGVSCCCCCPKPNNARPILRSLLLHTPHCTPLVPCFGSSGVVCTWVLYLVWYQVCITCSSGACVHVYFDCVACMYRFTWYGVVRCGCPGCGVVQWYGLVWYGVAGQVDVAHNGRDQGQTTKRGRDATFGQTVKFSNYCFPTIFDFSVWENIIFSFYNYCYVRIVQDENI